MTPVVWRQVLELLKCPTLQPVPAQQSCELPKLTWCRATERRKGSLPPVQMLLNAQLKSDGHRWRCCSQLCWRVGCRCSLLPQVWLDLDWFECSFAMDTDTFCSAWQPVSQPHWQFSVTSCPTRLEILRSSFHRAWMWGGIDNCVLQSSLLTVFSFFFRTAIFYNVVSSVFAAFGLLAGLLLGSQEGLSSWLLSATVTIMIS